MGAASRVSRYRDWYSSSGMRGMMDVLVESVRGSIVDARMVRGDQAAPACSAVARAARAAAGALSDFDRTPAHNTMQPADAALADASPDDKALSCADEARRACERAQEAVDGLCAQLDSSYEPMGGVHNDHMSEAMSSSAMLASDLMSARKMIDGAMTGR